MFLNNNSLRKSLIVAALVLLACSNYGAFAQKPTVWLVRHAEKVTTDANDKDLILMIQEKYERQLLIKF